MSLQARQHLMPPWPLLDQVRPSVGQPLANHVQKPCKNLWKSEGDRRGSLGIGFANGSGQLRFSPAAGPGMVNLMYTRLHTHCLMAGVGLVSLCFLVGCQDATAQKDDATRPRSQAKKVE